MRWNIKKNHDKLRMANGIAGHSLKDMDGKNYLVEDMLTITLIEENGSFNVVAVMRNGKNKELFGCSDYEYSMQELNKYRRKFDTLKELING